MAFIEHKLQLQASDTGIRATLRKFSKTPAKLVITLTPACAKSLGFVSGDKVQAFYGTGDDAGTIRLTKNNSAGSFELKTRHGRLPSFVFELDVVPTLPDESQTAKHCQWTVPTPGTIDVVLPSWARKKTKPATEAPQGTVPVKPASVVPANPQPLPNFNPTAARAAIERAKQMAPAPDFGGKQKPKLSRKDALAAVGKL